VSRFDLRLRRLEMQAEAEEAEGRTHVIRLGPDGCPEAWPANMGPNDRLIALPRKAPTAEVWQEGCAILLADREEWQAHQDARFRHWLQEDEDL
jgi:hypothetical protein